MSATTSPSVCSTKERVLTRLTGESSWVEEDSAEQTLGDVVEQADGDVASHESRAEAQPVRPAGYL